MKTKTIEKTYREKLKVEHLKNINLINKHKNKILAYSAMKIRANPNLPYSTLKPETSSDSPSEKSKGVRFVSANKDTIKIPVKGRHSTNLLQFILETFRK